MHAFLNKWLHNYLEVNQIKFNYLDSLDGDAGFRQYYRVNILDKDNNSKNYILTYAPPSTEKNKEFLNIHEIFLRNKLKVPHIYDYDLKNGFFLIEDLGNKLVYDYIKESDNIYKLIIDNLIIVQNIEDYTNIPQYNSNLMHTELRLCDEWFFKLFLSINNIDFEKSYQFLINKLQDQPKVLVHRDFQSKNLILSSDLDNVGLIDFQDAVIGPVTYDLASLLFDCYVDISADTLQTNLDYFYEKVKNQLPSKEIFLDWFYYSVLLRHIKNLGIFSRLYLRDNKKQYLQHIPRTLSYVLKALEYFSNKNQFKELCLGFNSNLQKIVNEKLISIGIN